MDDLWLQDNLTPKQTKYLALLASGLTTLQISKREHKSHHTIRNTITKAKERVGASSTSNLVATAVSKGWINPKDDEIPYEFTE